MRSFALSSDTQAYHIGLNCIVMHGEINGVTSQEIQYAGTPVMINADESLIAIDNRSRLMLYTGKLYQISVTLQKTLTSQAGIIKIRLDSTLFDMQVTMDGNSNIYTLSFYIMPETDLQSGLWVRSLTGNISILLMDVNIVCINP